MLAPLSTVREPAPEQSESAVNSKLPVVATHDSSSYTRDYTAASNQSEDDECRTGDSTGSGFMFRLDWDDEFVNLPFPELPPDDEGCGRPLPSPTSSTVAAAGCGAPADFTKALASASSSSSGFSLLELEILDDLANQ